MIPLKKWRFEHIFALSILAVLAGALAGAFAIGSTDLVNMLVVAFVGALGTITAFFFKDKHGQDVNVNVNERKGGDPDA